MQEQEPNTRPLEGLSTVSEATVVNEEQHMKTIAVRVVESLHAQMQFIAQLRGNTISDEVRLAIEGRVAAAQDDPELVARAQEVRQEIEREAAARAAAIAGFMGKPTVTEASGRNTRRKTNE